MAENIGIVIKAEADNHAQVVVDRKGACGGCRPTGGGCRSCLASAKIQSRVANPVNAKTGDLVKIHISSANLFSSAAILYLIPVLDFSSVPLPVTGHSPRSGLPTHSGR